jgi:hypothetical protein
MYVRHAADHRSITPAPRSYRVYTKLESSGLFFHRLVVFAVARRPVATGPMLEHSLGCGNSIGLSLPGFEGMLL